MMPPLCAATGFEVATAAPLTAISPQPAKIRPASTADKIALAIPLDPSQAEHLAGPHFDVDALQPIAADVLGYGTGSCVSGRRHLGRISVLQPNDR